MKKLLPLFIICLVSFNIFGQSGTMLPDGFILPNLAEAPACTVDDKGKIYFNTTTKLMMACDGTKWKIAVSQWDEYQALPNTIHYYGKVGINTDTPQYPLDVNGMVNIKSSLYVASEIGIGTTSPSTALEVVDGDIAISSSIDSKTWKFDYSDDDDYFTIKEDGTARMIFANGGNVGIGSVVPTAKLSVDGTGSFTGNLTVNGGKGIVRTTTSASMKTHITNVSLGTTFTVLAGNCATSSSLNISGAAYTFAPTVQVGNLVSGTGDFGKLIISIQSATATAVIVRFCNTTASNITLSNMVFNVLCIGI